LHWLGNLNMTLEVGYYVAQDAVEHWPEVAALVAQVL
jgi:hypothetical protein